MSLLAFLPGFFATIPPVDRDEARFAQATKQMVETGDVDIRFQDEVRYKKPVGIYWLQAAGVKAGEALGIRGCAQHIWLYRIPSLIGATRRGAADLLDRARFCPAPPRCWRAS